MNNSDLKPRNVWRIKRDAVVALRVFAFWMLGWTAILILAGLSK